MPGTITGRDTIISDLDNRGAYVGIDLALNDGKLQLTIGTTDDPWQVITAEEPLKPGEWSHVAATYDVTVSNQAFTMSLYHNGVRVASANVDVYSWAFSAGVSTFIGARPQVDGDLLSSFPFEGWIHSVRIEEGDRFGGADFTPGPLDVTASTIGQWSFNKSSGVEVENGAAAEDTPAVLMNGPSWATGCP